MVRVPRGEYHFIARALDVGALGVMVPMVGSADEAGHIVACTRYPPVGRRGAAFGFAHDDYEGGDVASKIAAIHARTLVIAQIETAEGLADVEAIAATPGVDALWLGPLRSHQLHGHPGRVPASGLPGGGGAHRRRLRSARQDRRVPGRRTTTGRASTRRYGFRLFAYGLDQAMLGNALRHGLDVLRR